MISMIMKVKELMTWQTFERLFLIVGVLVSVYASVLSPWLAAKPDLEFYTTPHYIGNNTAISSILIRNKGDAAAKNIGIYFELNRPYTIKKISSSPECVLAEGGEGDWRVKLTLDRLEPRNSLTVAIFIEADPVDINSIIPLILRVWSDTGILEEQGIE